MCVRLGSRCSWRFARSANSENSNNIWIMNDDGNLNNNNYNNNNGVRPTSFGTITYWTKVNKYKTWETRFNPCRNAKNKQYKY